MVGRGARVVNCRDLKRRVSIEEVLQAMDTAPATHVVATT